MFEERVDLRADKDYQPGDVEPQHQDDHRADSASGRIVVAEVAGGEGEPQRRGDQ